MTALALKERGGMATYPVSEEARERIDSADLRARLFEARRILAGADFRQQEIEAILAVVTPFLREGRPIDRETVRTGLIARQFTRIEAESLAAALAQQ